MADRKTYLILDKISPKLRILLSVLLIGTGFIFQLSSKNILVGLPFIIACVIINLLKGVSIKKVIPESVKWQEVTPEKIDQILSQCRKIKKFRSKDAGCFIIFVFVLMFVLAFSLPILSELSIPFALIATVVNAFILFAGLALSGRKSAWMPHALDIKARIVKRIINTSYIKNDPVLQAVPYLEIGNAKDGSFPNDTRILIRFKGAPKEFIGLQGQISINTVKGKPYPYFYVVLIARRGFDLFKKFGKHNLDKLVIERKRTEEADVIVIRQKTTKTSGYHTNEGVQDYILESCVTLAKSVL
jgi:hypothetical protein